MKYLFTFLLTFAIVYSDVVGQSIDAPVPNRQSGLGKNGLPFIGASVSIPLFKKYKQAKFKLPEPYRPLHSGTKPPADSTQDGPITSGPGDGPIAWEMTGDPAIVRGYRYYPTEGGFYGTGGGNEGGGGTNPQEEQPGPPDETGNDSEGPKPIKEARRVPDNYCANNQSIFKTMYQAQASRDKEQAAFLTDKGVFWLDDSENTHSVARLGNINSYGINNDGTRWFYHGGQVYNILAIVHTHPDNSATGVSQGDLDSSRDFKVPVYAIHSSGIYKGMPDRSQSVANHNPSVAFDCATAMNTFR